MAAQAPRYGQRAVGLMDAGKLFLACLGAAVGVVVGWLAIELWRDRRR